MKTFYSQTFAKYSPLFPFFIIALLIYGYILRQPIPVPEILSSTQIDFWGRFGFSQNFLIENSQLFFNIEFWVSLFTIVAGFLLGMSLIGKTSGLVIATFVGIYPHYIVNMYSTETISIFFFILFLFFQLQATVNYSKPLSAISGAFFMIAIICNPMYIFLGLITYIYQAIASRNIAVLYNFLLFIGGAFVIYIIYTIFLSLHPDNASFMPSIGTTFAEFNTNFKIFTSGPFDYIKNTIVPIFTDTLAYPAVYSEELNDLTYWHYLAIFSSIFGLLYSLIEQKARILTILTVIILIQSFFMTVNFGFLFLFVVMVGSYLIDKVFNDVFC